MKERKKETKKGRKSSESELRRERETEIDTDTERRRVRQSKREKVIDRYIMAKATMKSTDNLRLHNLLSLTSGPCCRIRRSQCLDTPASPVVPSRPVLTRQKYLHVFKSINCGGIILFLMLS